MHCTNAKNTGFLMNIFFFFVGNVLTEINRYIYNFLTALRVLSFTPTHITASWNRETKAAA